MPTVLDPNKSSPSTDPDLSDENDLLTELGYDPLSRMGYEEPSEPTPAETNPEQPEEIRPSVQERLEDANEKVHDLKDRYSQFKQRFQPKRQVEVAKEAGSTLKGVEKKALSGTVKKLETRAASELGKQAIVATEKQVAKKVAVQLGAKAAASAALAGISAGTSLLIQAGLEGLSRLWKNPTGRVVLIILATSPIWIGMIFAIIFLNLGTTIFPSTSAEKTQASALSAVSGSYTAKTELIFKNIQAERKRMDLFESWISRVYGNESGKAGQANSSIQEIRGFLKQLESAQDKDEQQDIIEKINSSLDRFSDQLPELTAFGSINGIALRVPAVLQAGSGDCGAASVLMVALYYKRDFDDSTMMEKLPRARRSTQGGSVCVSPGYLNSHTPHKDWTYASSSKASLEDVKKSLAGGDPVILYTAPGGIFGPSSKGFGGKHIVVIVGYDPSDKTFLINNPSQKKVEVATKRPGGRLQTEGHVWKFLGDRNGTYNHSFMIRSKYL